MKWTRTIQVDTFVASVDAISLVIIELQKIGGPSHYRLDLQNESGEVADSLDYEESSDAEIRLLTRLFALARRSANDVEATLEKLAKALDL